MALSMPASTDMPSSTMCPLPLPSVVLLSSLPSRPLPQDINRRVMFAKGTVDTDDSSTGLQHPRPTPGPAVARMSPLTVLGKGAVIGAEVLLQGATALPPDHSSIQGNASTGAGHASPVVVAHGCAAVASRACTLLVLGRADVERFRRYLEGPLGGLAEERSAFLQRRSESIKVRAAVLRVVLCVWFCLPSVCWCALQRLCSNPAERWTGCAWRVAWIPFTYLLACWTHPQAC